MIECGSLSLPPSGCLQYHTGPTGNFQTFNFLNGQILSSQAYRVCFRQELGKTAGNREGAQLEKSKLLFNSA